MGAPPINNIPLKRQGREREGEWKAEGQVPGVSGGSGHASARAVSVTPARRVRVVGHDGVLQLYGHYLSWVRGHIPLLPTHHP